MNMNYKANTITWNIEKYASRYRAQSYSKVVI